MIVTLPSEIEKIAAEKISSGTINPPMKLSVKASAC
jgi:hypothetical protein